MEAQKYKLKPRLLFDLLLLILSILALCFGIQAFWEAKAIRAELDTYHKPLKWKP